MIKLSCMPHGKEAGGVGQEEDEGDDGGGGGKGRHNWEGQRDKQHWLVF